MTNNTTSIPNRLAEFDEFYKLKLKPKLLEKYSGQSECIRTVMERFESVCDYNVPHGKKLRGLCVYEALLCLIDSLPLEYSCEVLIEQAKATGWCIEFMQASFLVADDIMDNSTKRRGQQCWYLKDNVGMIAINDAFFLLTSVFTIINEYLYNHPMYPRFYELFNQTITNTVIGQGLDLITPPKVKINEPFDFSNYTPEQYESIVKWKTAYYSFCLPAQSAFYLAFIDDKIVHDKCKDILMKMGHFFQIQDDYLDCYGDSQVTGKVGTDIEENKCSWLIVQALKNCNTEQRRILENSYGKQDKSKVASVKQVYQELNLKEEFEKFEEKTYKEITNEIDNLNFNLESINSNKTEKIRFILRNYAKKIFKRNK